MGQNQIDEVYNSLMVEAEKGTIETLYELLGKDSSILDKADKQFGDNPLHVAAKHNNALFADEIANLKPSLAEKLNQRWMEEMMVPLHCAAKSEVNPKNKKVIKELLSACPKCFTELTIRNETALHTAIVELLLCKFGYFVRRAVKKNAKNNKGKTALEVLTGSETQPVQEKKEPRIEEQGDEEEGKVLGDEDKENVQEKIEKFLKSSPCFTLWHKKDTKKKRVSKKERALDSGIKWLLKVQNFLSFKVNKDTSTEVRNALLVILILIVTVTYTTGINPPGGLWQDDGISNISQKQHNAGTSIWFDKNPDSFQLLMLCNYAGFLVSVVLVFNLTEGYTLRGPILLALFFMLITYALWIRLLFLSNGAFAVLINGIILIVPLPVALVLLVATANWIWNIKP
ncbi:uncharacterized protein LOC122665781 [Telopea speciosissima]|uniref:uncharacterized protein LOC122665781 n=1 Tax=Telopea speciosissima TaxID=54955 RepID=UPI001CC7B345|nr:uncharacterized protein LOC122665781 [Telopea speciosissima]